MSAPFYISPEQHYQEKAEYARKGIALGRPMVAIEYEGGVVMLAENRSTHLRKIAEIYDRIAFGGVGKLDEYENLRKAGIRYADLQGYSYSRDDVSGKSLANEYSTVLGSVFTREMKSLEVEILVVELGDETASFYRILFNGSLTDHDNYVSIGGDPDSLMGVLKEGWKENLSLPEAVALGCKALSSAGDGVEIADLDENALEIAVLDRSRIGRKFRRFESAEIKELLGR
jgi:proteasome alpha subunit